jgi:hypothetical protein
MNNYEYLGKTKNDKKPTFETIKVDVAKMKAVRIDKKTIKLVKK